MCVFGGRSFGTSKDCWPRFVLFHALSSPSLAVAMTFLDCQCLLHILSFHPRNLLASLLLDCLYIIT